MDGVEDNPDRLVALVAKLAENVMLSGGAAGADLAWGAAASKAGHQVIHWSFEGHKKASSHLYLLSQDCLLEADTYLEEANLTLNRRLNYGKPWLMNLLRRNWYQVKYAESIIAVGTLNEKAVTMPVAGFDLIVPPRTFIDRMGINGGTAWACQLYLDRWQRLLVDKGKDFFKEYLFDVPDSMLDCNIHFFDQDQEKLFFWNLFGKNWIEVKDCHKPTGIYAAIGTRNLNSAGRAFIESVFRQ